MEYAYLHLSLAINELKGLLLIPLWSKTECFFYQQVSKRWFKTVVDSIVWEGEVVDIVLLRGGVVELKCYGSCGGCAMLKAKP